MLCNLGTKGLALMGTQRLRVGLLAFAGFMLDLKMPAGVLLVHTATQSGAPDALEKKTKTNKVWPCSCPSPLGAVMQGNGGGAAGRKAVVPSCVPLMLSWDSPTRGGRKAPTRGFAQAIFFVLGHLGFVEPCWSSR